MGTFTLTSDIVVHVSTYCTYMTPMYVYICTQYLYTLFVHNSQGVYTHNRYTLNSYSTGTIASITCINVLAYSRRELGSSNTCTLCVCVYIHVYVWVHTCSYNIIICIDLQLHLQLPED